MFTAEFKTPARSGDSIRCEIGGIVYTATIERDRDAGAPDKEDEGFWPSLDPHAAGYVGAEPARSFAIQMADAQEIMRRHKVGKMIYCGVIVTAKKGDATLLEDYAHALWRVDVNWPQGDNAYLRTVANELLAEARPAAEKALADRIAKVESLLATLKA